MLDTKKIEVWDLSESERITEPGFYRLPLDRHHAQPVDGISVTSSVLRSMCDYGPGHTWAFSLLNKNRYLRGETRAMYQGRAMAALVEGGVDELERCFQILPDQRPDRPTKRQLDNYHAGKFTDAALASIDFWGRVENDPRDHITESEYVELIRMGKVLAQDPIARACLQGQPEITMAWYDEETRLWVLSRPDVLTFDGLLSDYKKISTQDKPLTGALLDRKISAFRYDMQMGLAAEAFEHLTGVFPTSAGLVFQMDAEPYFPMVRCIDEEDLRIGAFECQRQRRRFRECFDSGHWPAPGEHIGSYRRNPQQLERYREEMNHE